MDQLIERRRFPRYPIYCPVQYKYENERARDEAVALNVSEGGVLLSTSRIVDVSARLVVRVLLKRGEFALPAKVVHIHHNGCDQGVYNLGVEFLERPAPFVERLYEEIDGITVCQSHLAAESGTEVSMAEASMKWYSESNGWWH